MRQPPKIRTSAERIARVTIWVTFALVLLVRFVAYKDDRDQPPPPRQAFPQQERRFRRPPTQIHPPVAEVPKDLPRLHIEIKPEDIEVLRAYFWNGWRGQRSPERPEVIATVREGDRLYTNVVLHLKGAAGSFRGFDDKPALTLNFGKNARGQQFHGYSKVSLNNSVQDPSFLCEALARELFTKSGVPAPQADYATVLINGRDLGLYVLLEGYNKDFLRRHFENVTGNLYDGGFCQDVYGELTVNSGNQPKDRSGLVNLLAAAQEPSATRRAERLERVLDTDRFTTLLALEVLLCHWDGYGLNRNNYRLFEDRATGRMVFMPHGMDQLFEAPANRFPVDSTVYPNMRGIVAHAWLSTPQGNRKYLERLRSLSATVFQEEPLVRRALELSQRIHPTLEAYGPNVAKRHEAMVTSLCDRIQRRVRSVSEQLQHPRQPLEFDQSGLAPLPHWTERGASRDSNFQWAQLEQNGENLLHLVPVNGGGTGSWRTRTFLEAGRYRFEGRAKVSADAVGSRVSLRVSGNGPQPGPPANGTAWIPLSYPFVIQSYLAEVVLMCEFRGSRGEAWFDVNSLRLVREGE